MKVKIAELKTHLSKYVQSLRDGGEPIEVCVREQTVAYLSASETKATEDHSASVRELEKRLALEGLRLHAMGQVTNRRYKPGFARDGKHPENSVVAIRKERDW